MRRSRFSRSPTGKSISPLERDIALFHAIYRHGPLPTSFLYEFTKHLGRDKDAMKHRLEALYHETTTLHGGPYIDRPERQADSFFARYQELLHELTPQSEQALKDAGLLPEPYHYVKRNLPHQHMKANITASIELACKKVGAI